MMSHANSQILSTNQFYRLIPLLIIPTGYLTLPTVVAAKAGNGGWLSPLISMVAGVVSVICIGTLYKTSPKKDIVQWTNDTFGPVIGRIFSISFSAFCLFSGMMVVLEIVGFLSPMIMRTTPVFVILSVILGAIAFMLYHGLEGIARISGVLYVSLLALTMVFIFSSIGAFHKSALVPVLNQGFSGVIAGSYVPLSWFGEVVILAMYFPYISKKHTIRIRSLLMRVTISAFLLSGVTTTAIGVLGDAEAARATYPTFEVIRYCQGGDFIQHVDALFLIHWVAIMILKSLMFYQAGILGLSQSCGIPQTRLLIIPTTGVCLPLALWLFPDQHSVAEYHKYVFPNYALIFEILLPLVLCILNILKTVRHRKLVS